jgi:hypothetical protein
MKGALILILAASPCAFAQDNANAIHYQTTASMGAIAWGRMENGSGAPVQGAPYSASITNKSIQTLADGTHVEQTGMGTTARDSQGRTRRDAPLPTIGDLPADAPHLVFIEDPVTQTSYVLNLTDKTAQEIPESPAAGDDSLAEGETRTFFGQRGSGATASSLLAPLAIAVPNGLQAKEQGSTESLGSQTMEGVLVNGVRTTRIVPAGQIGNAELIKIVTEVWTSPDLKAVVYSKRSDPLMGEEIYQLTNIVRAEPDPSLFTIPADFKVIDGPEAMIYRAKQRD